jgi:predicted PurR-regulated permease PerM
MEKFKNALTLVLTILVVVVLYFVVSGNSKLKETQNTINQVNKELSVLKDSISKAQQLVTLVLNKLEFTENELKILKNERDILELEEQQRGTRNKEELKVLKEQILKKEEMKKELQKYANTFEL